MGIYLGSLSNDSSVADIGEGTYIDIFADLRLRGNESQRVDTFLCRFHRIVELEELGNALIGVLHADKCRADGLFQLDILVDEDDARLGVINVMGVFGIRQEG